MASLFIPSALHQKYQHGKGRCMSVCCDVAGVLCCRSGQAGGALHPQGTGGDGGTLWPAADGAAATGGALVVSPLLGSFSLLYSVDYCTHGLKWREMHVLICRYIFVGLPVWTVGNGRKNFLVRLRGGLRYVWHLALLAFTQSLAVKCSQFTHFSLFQK